MCCKQRSLAILCIYRRVGYPPPRSLDVVVDETNLGSRMDVTDRIDDNMNLIKIDAIHSDKVHKVALFASLVTLTAQFWLDGYQLIYYSDVFVTADDDDDRMKLKPNGVKGVTYYYQLRLGCCDENNNTKYHLLTTSEVRSVLI